jgi:site-specific recombinase XerD
MKNPRVCNPIVAAGFKPSLEKLVTKLHSCGYAEPTISFYGQAAVHFAYCRRHLNPSQIDEHQVASFLSRHLPTCRCPFGGVRQQLTVRAALRHFAAILHGDSAMSNHKRKLSAIDSEVRSFDDYLCTASGLQEATRIYRRRYIREFLLEFFDHDCVNLSRLTPKNVIQYLSKRAFRLKPQSAKVLASSLRSYFRFLRLRGKCEESLILAVPAPSSYKLASLPRVLTDGEVNRLLAVFDRRTASGRRDYAITRCLMDLGLRAEEVARLRLEDIDWRKGTLQLVGSKSRRDDQLPLPNSLAAAIATYIRRGRLKTSQRQVFLRVRPPIERGVTRRTVCNVIIRAAARAGMKSVITGTRILRHTAATRMLHHGASLKEVADVLRHRCLDTTKIYTKVDLPRLALVAVPWPE